MVSSVWKINLVINLICRYGLNCHISSLLLFNLWFVYWLIAPSRLHILLGQVDFTLHSGQHGSVLTTRVQQTFISLLKSLPVILFVLSV